MSFTRTLFFKILIQSPANVLVSLTQLIETLHNICQVRRLNPDHKKKKGPANFASLLNDIN